MTMPDGESERWHIRSGDWKTLKAHAIPIRHAVFVIEQNVPEALELDDQDARCRHWLVLDEQGSGIATGRLTPSGHIGRLAVLAPWRGQGVGSALIRDMLRHARDTGMEHIYLNAQTHAIGFYGTLGFAAEGPEFDDAGIPHRRMIYGRAGG